MRTDLYSLTSLAKVKLNSTIFTIFSLEEREPRFLRTVGEFAEQASLKKLSFFADSAETEETTATAVRPRDDHLERHLCGCLFLLVLVTADADNENAGSEIKDFLADFTGDNDLDVVKVTEYVQTKQDHFMVRP